MLRFNSAELLEFMLARNFILILTVILGAPSQAALLRGIVHLNELEGSTVPDVSVTADGAQPTVTDSDGRFDLVFPRKNPGELVEIAPKKEGLVVVHSIMLQQVLLADSNAPRVKILLAKDGDREEMARRFFRLKGTEAVEQNYQQRLKELQDQHQTDATPLTRLQRELEQAKAATEKAADDFARDKPGEHSQMYLQAMRLYLAGKVDQALEVLDDAKIEQRKSDAKRLAQELARDYQLRGQLLVLKFRFAEAAKAYESAVETAPDDFDAQFALGSFNQGLNHQKQALTAYLRCLELARKTNNLFALAGTLNNLGRLHRAENRQAEARKAYEEALQTFRELATKNPDTYLPLVALTLNNLGILHSDENRMTEARKAFEEALQIYRELAIKNPDTCLPDVAMTLNNLGKR